MSTIRIARTIGVRHRVKKTVAGEAHPTQLFIQDHSTQKEHVIELEDDDAELDFVLGRFPTSWRTTTADDKIEGLPAHHIKWKRLKADDDLKQYPEHLVRKDGKTNIFAAKIPDTYDGQKVGDSIAMILGGSGDRFAFALANRGKKFGSKVYRIPTFVFKDKRPGDKDFKDDDAKVLVQVFSASPELFYEVRPRDENLIVLREALCARIDAMKARIGCEQRLRQRFVGKVFLSTDGHFPEGSIEDEFDALKASDPILMNLKKEEARTNVELARACHALDVYRELFDPIEGCGPAIGSRIISAITDIRRFETKAKLKAFMGAHVLKDGRFPRRRVGEVSNWHPDARQALYLIAADQFNRRPGSFWGKKLREYKVKLREKHPEPVIGENGKKKYTDGHIHKMALWRTATKFVESLWRNWWDIEGGKMPVPVAPSGSDDVAPAETVGTINDVGSKSEAA